MKLYNVAHSRRSHQRVDSVSAFEKQQYYGVSILGTLHRIRSGVTYAQHPKPELSLFTDYEHCQSVLRQLGARS